MPKKFKGGDNPKAAEARTRKEAAKQLEDDKKDRQKEDELWKDDDKHVARKSQRKEQKESKRLEQLERKKELQVMHDEEMASIKTVKATPPPKVTRAQIVEREEKKQAEAAKSKPKASIDEVPLVENINRLEIEGNEARTVDEAISVMNEGEVKLEKHPEKRLKAAYAAFEEQRLPVLKAENSNMRLSQIKQLLKKEWQKSPDNPLNQQHSSFNRKA